MARRARPDKAVGGLDVGGELAQVFVQMGERQEEQAKSQIDLLTAIHAALMTGEKKQSAEESAAQASYVRSTMESVKRSLLGRFGSDPTAGGTAQMPPGYMPVAPFPPQMPPGGPGMPPGGPGPNAVDGLPQGPYSGGWGGYGGGWGGYGGGWGSGWGGGGGGIGGALARHGAAAADYPGAVGKAGKAFVGVGSIYDEFMSQRAKNDWYISTMGVNNAGAFVERGKEFLQRFKYPLSQGQAGEAFKMVSAMGYNGQGPEGSTRQDILGAMSAARDKYGATLQEQGELASLKSINPNIDLRTVVDDLDKLGDVAKKSGVNFAQARKNFMEMAASFATNYGTGGMESTAMFSAQRTAMGRNMQNINFGEKFAAGDLGYMAMVAGRAGMSIGEVQAAQYKGGAAMEQVSMASTEMAVDQAVQYLQQDPKAFKWMIDEIKKNKEVLSKNDEKAADMGVQIAQGYWERNTVVIDSVFLQIVNSFAAEQYDSAINALSFVIQDLAGGGVRKATKDEAKKRERREEQGAFFGGLQSGKPGSLISDKAPPQVRSMLGLDEGQTRPKGPSSSIPKEVSKGSSKSSGAGSSESSSDGAESRSSKGGNSVLVELKLTPEASRLLFVNPNNDADANGEPRNGNYRDLTEPSGLR